DPRDSVVPRCVRLDAALHRQRRRREFPAGLLRRDLPPRQRVTLSLSAPPTSAVVLDIEGTTTPVDFVYQVLFPYARAHVGSFLEREWRSASCGDAVSLLLRERGANLAEPADVEAYVFALMDEDRKSPGLKMLQGLIWRDGYEKGELHGSVYADVPPA